MTDSIMQQLDALIDAYEGQGCDRIDLFLGADERRQLREEIMALTPVVRTDAPAAGSVVERYRGHQILLMNKPGVYAVGYRNL